MPPSAIWDLFFESFYFRDYFHECVARVKIIENKMTRKINLILHELEVYVKRFIVWYEGIRSLLANPFLRTKALHFPPNYTYVLIFDQVCNGSQNSCVFFALTPWSTSKSKQNKKIYSPKTKTNRKKLRSPSRHFKFLKTSFVLLFLFSFVFTCFDRHFKLSIAHSDKRFTLHEPKK